MARMSARDALEAIADPGTFTSWDLPLSPDTPFTLPTPPDALVASLQPVAAGYREELRSAGSQVDGDEAVLTGEVLVGGVRAAVIAWEFGFLGGSVGIRTAHRIVAAVRRATRQGLPLLAMPRSGGTRMQEGSPAFIQMVAITGALAEHRDAGLPYLVHLCGPTTGGVLATLGSAGDHTSAEPGAMVGFLGPRAFAAITGGQFPSGVQVAENLLRHGLLDAVLDWEALARRWAILLHLWAGRAHPAGRVGRAPLPDPGGSGPAPGGAAIAGAVSLPGAPGSARELWGYVEASRAPDRVDAERLLGAHMTDLVRLPGTGAGDVASGTAVAVGRLLGMPIMVAATEDRRTGQPLTVGGLRTVRRAIDLAGRWGLPVLTIVDTLGAQLSVEGEQAGIAGEISRVMLALVRAPTPTASLLLGAGTGGAALALLATDWIVAGSHTWVAPLAPEGAAAIRHGGTHDPAALAWEQRIGAHALAELGFIDRVVRESEPDWMAVALQAVVDGLQRAPRRRTERFAAWT